MLIEGEIKLTPVLAEIFYRTSVTTRPESFACIQSMMISMLTKKFNQKKNCLTFNKNGQLVDGRHRLRAFALSELPYIKAQIKIEP